MFRSIIPSILLLLSYLHLTLAFGSIDVPSTVTANTEVNVTINNDLSKGAQSYDREFDSFRVSLSISYKGNFTEVGPSCALLVNATMGTRDIGGKLPIDIGQDGAYYAIAVQPFNQDPNNRTVNNSSVGLWQYSKPFTVTGTNGTWAQFELDGRSPGWAEFMSCSAYNCVRNCYSRSYPQDWTEDPCGDAQRTAYNCSMQCPNTIIPNWPDEIVSLYGADCSHLSFLPLSTQTFMANATTITIQQSSTIQQSITGSQANGFSTKGGGPARETGSPTKKSLAAANTLGLRNIWALLGILLWHWWLGVWFGSELLGQQGERTSE